MWLRWLNDSWTLRSDIGGGLGFCVWALQVDGLQVAPFTHHPEGDGHLRALGLTTAVISDREMDSGDGGAARLRN